MLTVTEDAKVFLKGLIDDNNVPEDATIRLTASPQGLGLAPDAPKADDETFDHDGRTVLAIAQPIVNQLDGKSIDVNQTENGPALAIG
ncbi:MAG: hypothetical protein RIB60_03015 [Phycisphaerales bacterium]